ncbi:diguanylate cyclase [Acetobacter sp.]|uniref:GGDEF domain-containing protein n=1 Tax=Acetobacter sp. TaxID=440 RepID=UPI0039E8B5EA
MVQPLTMMAVRDRQEWLAIINSITPELRQKLAPIMGEHAEACIARFYQVLLANPDAAQFISMEAIRDRLHNALTDWLIYLFPSSEPDVDKLIALQQHIGLVHARMRIPMRLILQGVRALKDEIRIHLFDTQMPRDQLLIALTYTAAMIDFAIEVMGQEFAKDLAREIESDEACRLVSLGQDIAVEKETQRASLLDWGHKLLLAICCAHPPPYPPLEKSGFGLWLNHKASLLFSGKAGLSAVKAIMRKIDRELLPDLEAVYPVAPAKIQEFQESLEEIRFLMDDMFAENALLEGGRDPLTATLSRRFLAAILSREISQALRRQIPFCVLLLDVDHFKLINDQFGHAHGDTVLRTVSDVITEVCRPSDFIFRYGGEEFLLTLVETELKEGLAIAERIRNAMLNHPKLREDRVTVSIGVTMFDRHPDYEHLIQQADAALYEAKRQGRNRCVSYQEQS